MINYHQKQDDIAHLEYCWGLPAQANPSDEYLQPYQKDFIEWTQVEPKPTDKFVVFKAFELKDGWVILDPYNTCVRQADGSTVKYYSEKAATLMAKVLSNTPTLYETRQVGNRIFYYLTTQEYQDDFQI